MPLPPEAVEHIPASDHSSVSRPIVVWFIHGSATDRRTWSFQRRSLRLACFERVFYDRAGCGARRSEPPHASVEAHAEELEDAIAAWQDRDSLAEHWLVGSSFGGIIALQILAERRVDVRGAVVCEPPLDLVAPGTLARQLEDLDAAAHRDPRGAAYAFLSQVLGERMRSIPSSLLEQALSMWSVIAADCRAALSFTWPPNLRTRSDALWLVHGDRSPPWFASVHAALVSLLPEAKTSIVPNCGHLMHAEAPAMFDSIVRSSIESRSTNR